MKRTSAIVLLELGLLALALPASSAAKNVQSATICGASGCHEAIGRDVSAGLVEGGAAAPPPPGRAPWYSVRATIGGDGGHGTMRIAVVPTLGLIRGCCRASGYSWLSMTPAGRRAYARLTRVLDPFPASSLRGAAPVRAARTGAGHRPSSRGAAISAGGLGDGGGGGFPAWASVAIGAWAAGITLGVGWRRRSHRAS